MRDVQTNNEAAKLFLLKGRKLQREVEQLKIAKSEAFQLACGMSVDYTNVKVQTSSGNGTETRFAAYSEYARLLDEKVEELLTYRVKMLEQIKRVENSTYRTLLISRYINCKTWESIADDMLYDVRHVHRLHGAALRNFKDVMECKSMNVNLKVNT